MSSPSNIKITAFSKDPITDNFPKKYPDDCAKTFFSSKAFVFYTLLAILTAVCAFSAPKPTYIVFVIILFCVYVPVVLIRLLVAAFSLSKHSEYRVPKEEIEKLTDDDLDTYTILVPLYKEAVLIPQIRNAVDYLNYPKEKLDVKILLEADDTETLEAIKKIDLPDIFEIIIMGEGAVKTKPRACNYGLKMAKGKYITIYDAEDVPDPDQLKKVVAAFNMAPNNIVCFQAKLDFFNVRQNWLTIFFTMEYCVWFDLFLPGLHALGLPIPLGGTSNHFKVDILKEIGGWDPYNVTEDCDLGIRLAKQGYRTGVINSITLEEANSKLGNWLRQRSRWIKGYFQTYLVHTNKPVRMFRGLGFWPAVGMLLFVGGRSFTLLINPFLWAVVYYRLFVAKTSYSVNPVWADSILVTTLVLSMFLLFHIVYMALYLIACSRRNLKDVYWYIPGIPFYWLVMCLAAWKGFLQLIYKPFFWEKTIHGLSETH